MAQSVSEENPTGNLTLRISAAVVVIAALILLPSPLLPPHYWAEKLQFIIGPHWKLAYLVVTLGLQAVAYFFIGVIGALVVRRAATPRKRLFQVLVVPVVIVLVALLIRSWKMGSFPVWINAAVPMAACTAGVWIGLGLIYRRGMVMILFTAVVVGATVWALSGTMEPELTKATENQLRLLIAERKKLPSGEARFGKLLQVAFSQSSENKMTSAVQHNRAAILALGIALGHEHLAKFVDLDYKQRLLNQAKKLRKGTTLRGRHDWPQHFCLSAALSVLENPLVSDAGGLLKEQMDALTGGSGFSFGDIAADRAGIRFAQAATNSEEDALAFQKFLQGDYDSNNFLPPTADLPENLTTEQFRARYGATGSQAYRQQIRDIESRLDSCKALSPLRGTK